MALTERKEAFCQAYAITRNGAKSAREAGYSEKTAAVTASKLLKEDEVALRIKELSAEISTDVNVAVELEKQYLAAKASGHGQTAIKALEALQKVRGATPDDIKSSPETLEKEVIRMMEILGEDKMVELLSKCNWNYSKPLEHEEKEAEKFIEKQTVKV